MSQPVAPFVPSTGPALGEVGITLAVGKVTLALGTATASVPGVVTTDVVFATYDTTNNPGTLEARVTAPGVVTFTSSNGADASVVSFSVVRP